MSFHEEFRRAAERRNSLPPWARPVVTRPMTPARPAAGDTRTDREPHYASDGAPYAEQARELVLENRRLTETLRRVEAWVVSMDDLARQYREAAAAVTAPDLVRQAHDHAEDVQASADGVRNALDGQQ